VCLETLTTKHVQLACSHMLCIGCSTKCGNAGFRHCPICREPHLLHPSRLAQRSSAWRKRYAAWRGGHALGAHGELSSIRVPSSHEELAAFMEDVGHSSVCGDVHRASSSRVVVTPEICEHTKAKEQVQKL